jgi:hypothetical protein
MADNTKPSPSTPNPKTQEKKYRHKNSRAPSRNLQPPINIGPATCNKCNVVIPDIKREKWVTYYSDACKKANKLTEHIETLVIDNCKRDCLKAMNELDAMYDDTEVYPQYMARVTYDRRTSTHSGYCSDPYDIDTKDFEMDAVVYLPLFRDFKNADIDLQNQITNYEKIRKYYSVPGGYSGCCCSRGSTKYTINSVEVVDKKPRIKLDD